MALKKCKECGEDVSTKAEACPKCGAKIKKKTSAFTWLVLFLIIFIVYVANQGTTPTSSTKSSASLDNSNTNINATPKTPSWTTHTSKDKMTGKFSAYATSPRVEPTKRMSFPYGDVTSWIGVGCNSEDEWVYFGFNKTPNISNDDTKDGFNLITTRVKWNSNVETVELTQSWGADYIHFRNDRSAISKIAASNTVLLELDWHGQSGVYFEYSLKGSSKAISKIRSQCKSRG